ncbi:hypothetical protein ACM614_29440 [Streptomyces sp. 12297]
MHRRPRGKRLRDRIAQPFRAKASTWTAIVDGARPARRGRLAWRRSGHATNDRA